MTADLEQSAREVSLTPVETLPTYIQENSAAFHVFEDVRDSLLSQTVGGFLSGIEKLLISQLAKLSAQMAYYDNGGSDDIPFAERKHWDVQWQKLLADYTSVVKSKEVADRAKLVGTIQDCLSRSLPVIEDLKVREDFIDRFQDELSRKGL